MILIPDKTTFLSLSNRGLLGNRLRSWNTLADLSKSKYKGWLTVRARSKQSPWFVSEVHTGEPLVSALLNIQVQGGPGPEAFFFQQIPPKDASRAVNLEAGFVAHPGDRLCAYIECDMELPVRGIRERAHLYVGIKASCRLKSCLRQESWQTLESIWERYPAAIIEATEFCERYGVDNQHLVVWEVREY